MSLSCLGTREESELNGRLLGKRALVPALFNMAQNHKAESVYHCLSLSVRSLLKAVSETGNGKGIHKYIEFWLTGGCSYL